MFLNKSGQTEWIFCFSRSRKTNKLAGAQNLRRSRRRWKRRKRRNNFSNNNDNDNSVGFKAFKVVENLSFYHQHQ